MFRKIWLLCLTVVAAAALHAQTPVTNAKKRTSTISINGNPNENIWEFTGSLGKRIVGTSNNVASYAVLWDSLSLYLAVKITDANKYNESANGWDDDALEVYIDADNNGGTTYGVNDRQFVKEWNSAALWEKTNKTTGIQHAWANITGGYAIEMLIPWSTIGITNPKVGFRIGFDLANDDDDNGGVRETQLMWAGDANNWQYPQNFGDLVLAGTDLVAPAPPTNLVASGVTQSTLSLNWTAATDNVGVAGYDVYRNGTKINTTLVSATSYNVTSLNAATAYQFYVQAKDAAGNSSPNSNTVTITTPDTQAPTAPANLAASGITQTSMTISWSASTDNVAVTGYDVYRDGVKLNSTPVTGTNFNATGLTAGMLYSFYVQARDAAGNNTNSNSLNATTALPPDNEAPSTPVNLAVSGNVHTSVTLVWEASTDNTAVSGYDLYQNNIKVNATLIKGTSYTAGNLAALTQYSFYVVARDAGGNSSANSATVSIITPDTQAPTAPANLVAQNITATGATISWSASSDNVAVTGYDVYQNGIKINEALLTENPITVSNLSEGTTYNFFVKASDAAGNTSANSNTLSVLTLDVQAPTAPAGLASSNLTATSVSLNWTASSDNVGVTGYDVYKNGIKANAGPITGTSFNATGLTPLTAYSFYVQARDAAGNLSASSIAAAVTTPAAPGCSGTGMVNYAQWNNVTGSMVASFTSMPGYPNAPSVTGTLSSFEIPANSGDNYGIKVFGYLCPPTTGNYTFWIAGDDNCELWLSTSGSSAGKQKIAFHTSYTNAREWNKFTTQKSATIALNSGQLYYIEALLKEGTGGDNLAVGWAKPGQAITVPSEVIPGSVLVAQVADVQAPTAPLNLRAAETMQTTISLNWMAATDDVNVSGYDVYNGSHVKVNASTITTLSYNVTGLTPSTQYSFYVKAKDGAGNVSGNSNTVTANTVMPKPTVENFTQRTIIANQRMPHDLVYGPDNNLWYTERFGGTVSFINPATGAKRVVLALGANMVRTGGQDGLMGLALHPQFKAGKPYVYISYTYQSTSTTVRKTRIARYTYDSAAQNLIAPVTIIENIPGSNDHNSARLAIGPDLRLYYSIGDMGSGQFDNLARTQNAQNLNVLEGKILRLNTEAVNNSWIPSDNPFINAGVISPVYSLGHRNPQGLVWGNVNNTPILYSSEHGPYSDDELNIIEQGRNYGWPAVAGFCDGNYNGRFLGGAITQSEQNSCAALNMKEPLRSLFPVVRPPDSTTSNLTWPSTAPSGMDFYGSEAIPGWQNSLLVAQLKAGTIARFKMSSDGQFIISDTINYFRGKGRFRDVVVSPDGLKIYVACDSSGSTSGPTGGVTSTPANPGSILEFTYQPGIAARSNLSAESQMTDVVNDKTIDVYPNPASAYIIVYNHSGAEGRLVTLTDLNGRMIQKHMLRNRATRMETGNLANGVYLVTIRDAGNNTLQTEKIIVQR